MRCLKVAVLACAFASNTLVPRLAAAPQRRELDFTLVNGTPDMIMHLYVSPTRGHQWGGDVLGNDILMPGEHVELSFSRSEPTCTWDLKIVNEDKRAREWQKLNLCDASRITLRYDNGKPTAIVR